ncbi:hypothetical protein NDU88_003639 [Pleurodeles waltl]|uniref:Uncharacterized protein n=1 Tax=Pleurodeles waltl TaxID=8319 RepID=A0AAV7VER4_PLEWA|nr:hypothetical protein NDU88_003639 [Pleurodeles waltl]
MPGGQCAGERQSLLPRRCFLRSARGLRNDLVSQRVRRSGLRVSPFIRRVRRFGALGGQRHPIPDRGVLGFEFSAGGPEMPAPPGVASPRTRMLPAP